MMLQIISSRRVVKMEPYLRSQGIGGLVSEHQLSMGFFPAWRGLVLRCDIRAYVALIVRYAR